ncbi:MAG: YjcZ family sporulation protein [bacterium]
MATTCGCSTSNTENGYALILVLFILLVIIGAAWLV